MLQLDFEKMYFSTLPPNVFIKMLFCDNTYVSVFHYNSLVSTTYIIEQS